MQTKRKMPLLVLRGLTILPKTMLHMEIQHEVSVKAITTAMEEDQIIFLVSQKNSYTESPNLEEDIYQVGTIAKIKQVVKLPKNKVAVVAEGLERGKLLSYEEHENFYFAEVLPLESESPLLSEEEQSGFYRSAGDILEKYISTLGKGDFTIKERVMEAESIGEMADAIATHLFRSVDKKQEILEELDEKIRIEKAFRILLTEIEIAGVQKKIHERIRRSLDKNQKNYVLKEQLRAIQRELGEEDEDEFQEYENKIAKLKADVEVKEKLHKDLNRLKKMMSGSPDATTIRNYLEMVLEYPWNKTGKESFHLKKAEQILEEDHYGLQKVKERVVEYLAVRSLSKNNNSPIICLVGPPGTGKTSIVKSIAKALNRKYVRISLGGVRDEAEIRGHRKTYIGAMPGRIIAAMTQAKVNNPLILLDELDKMSSDFRGNPAAALLEVLDGEQNKNFRDHYMEVPVDLSKVLFIATANTLSTIPRPLLDRLEIIEISSYSIHEKFHIAKQYLLPKQMQLCGLPKDSFEISDAAIYHVIEAYTKESGVRNLERKLGDICRKIAKEVVMNEVKKMRVHQNHLRKYLGVPRYHYLTKEDHPEIGVARGLAWTEVGGDTLSIEVALMHGKGDFRLTGRLGEVMKESANTAMSFLRSKIEEYHLPAKFYKENDFHIHIPEGAVPKDGPSAGITMATAMLSAVLRKAVRNDIAMTGELTLRGRVLAIGGIKEKILAARRAGIFELIVPQQNQAHVMELEKEITKGLQIHYVSDVEEVFAIALIGFKEKKNDYK